MVKEEEVIRNVSHSLFCFSLPASLLDEVLGSAVHRCLDAILMEPNAVEIICERS